jgi:hypothetical protein
MFYKRNKGIYRAKRGLIVMSKTKKRILLALGALLITSIIFLETIIKNICILLVCISIQTGLFWPSNLISSFIYVNINDIPTNTVEKYIRNTNDEKYLISIVSEFAVDKNTKMSPIFQELAKDSKDNNDKLYTLTTCAYIAIEDYLKLPLTNPSSNRPNYKRVRSFLLYLKTCRNIWKEEGGNFEDIAKDVAKKWEGKY